MLDFFFSALFFGIPVAATVFFVVCLCRYLVLKHQARVESGNLNGEDLKRRKILLIVSAVIFGVVMTVAISFVALLILAIAYM